MTVKHLSEMEIQQYVLEKSLCSPWVMAHMQSCGACRAEGAAYALLFSEIGELPVAAFDFDLREAVLRELGDLPGFVDLLGFIDLPEQGDLLVLSDLPGRGDTQVLRDLPGQGVLHGAVNGSLRVPADVDIPDLPQHRLRRGTVWYGIATVLTGGWGCYYFQDYIANLFTGISSMLFYFILITVGTVSIFLLTDMYSRYQRKMNILQHLTRTSD